MLEFGIDADAPARLGFLGLHQLQDLGKGGNGIETIELRILRPQARQAFLRAQRAQFGQGEIFGEPAAHQSPVDGLGSLAVGKFLMVGDIGRVRQFVFMARDQHHVLGHHQIGFDIISPLIDRAFICGQRMLRPFAAGAAMRDYDEVGSLQRQRREQHGKERDRSKRRPIGGNRTDHGRQSSCSWPFSTVRQGCSAQIKRSIHMHIANRMVPGWPLLEGGAPFGFVEPDQQAAGIFDHGPLDHAGIGLKQTYRFRLVDIGLLRVR